MSSVNLGKKIFSMFKIPLDHHSAQPSMLLTEIRAWHFLPWYMYCSVNPCYPAGEMHTGNVDFAYTFHCWQYANSGFGSKITVHYSSIAVSVTNISPRENTLSSLNTLPLYAEEFSPLDPSTSLWDIEYICLQAHLCLTLPWKEPR